MVRSKSSLLSLYRPWTDYNHRFGWANGMFGQMILDIEARMPHLLNDSYQ